MTWQDKFQSAILHQRAGRLDSAERDFRAAIAANPGFAKAHQNLGTILRYRGRYRQAIHAFETARKLDPDLTGIARTSIGIIFTQTGEYARAEDELRAAVAAAPSLADAHRFLGDLLRTTNRIEEARSAYLDALRCDPADAEAEFGLAFVRLALGEMPEAWDNYESRKSRMSSPALQPLWTGENLAGRTLLVHGEQGIGDAIQFLRYVPLLAKMGARVLVAGPMQLVKLMASLEGAAEIVEPTFTLPSFDFSCPLPSLPRMFRTTLASVPGNVPYLSADPARVAAWREKLGEADGLTVALAWRGNPNHRNDHRRSILKGQLAPVFDVPNVRFLVVQRDDADAPTAENVVKLGAHDLEDIAAILSLADLSISVDTVFCHLAGALGRPVWTLLCTSPDWRWRPEGDATPWYPTMRLFRQHKQDDWAGVVSDVVAALAEVQKGGGLRSTLAQVSSAQI